MIDLGTYKDRFAESGQRVLEHAVQESRRRDQNYIAVEHILNGLAAEEAELFNSTMRDLALDPRSVKVLIEKRLENARYQNVNKGIRIAPDTIELFKRSMERARAQGRKTIEATDLFMAFSQDENSALMGVLRNLGANPETVVEQVQLRSEASLRKLASQEPIFSHDHRNLELARDQKWLIAKLLRKSGRIDQKNTAALSPVTTREHIKFHSPGFQKFSQEKNERSLSGTSGRQISDADHRSPQPVC